MAFIFGNPNLFVKGMADITITDFNTGDIIGYDSVASESAVESSVNMGEITGGVGNPLLMTIPDTTRVNGTLTSQAFSLEQRAKAIGGNVENGGIVPVCETITATGTSLVVTGTPVKQHGQLSSDTTAWCYVKQQGASSYEGKNYGVNPTTKTVNFTAVSGTTYEVFYFVQSASAKSLEISSQFAPSVATVSVKYNIYSKQNGSVGNGTLYGYLYVVVPRAQFNADGVGINASQTENATTSYGWSALAETDNMPSAPNLVGGNCGADASPYAYYIVAPCGDQNQRVKALAVAGGGVSVGVGSQVQIPVFYVMDDNTLYSPDYSDMEYVSAEQNTATVGTTGVVSGIAKGDTTVTITLTKADNSVLKTTCSITVTD